MDITAEQRAENNAVRAACLELAKNRVYPGGMTESQWHADNDRKFVQKKKEEKEALHRQLFIVGLVLAVLFVCWWGGSHTNKYPEDSPYYSN